MGIVSYGAYLPQLTIFLAEIEKAQAKEVGSVSASLKVKQKTVPDFDEDSATIAVEAAGQALGRGGDKKKISSLFIGSESHPYAVKPTGTMVAQALGLSENLSTADLQFACKAGTQALQIVASFVLSGFGEQGLAIGADTAQAEPGDALEFTASAGGAAFVLGKTKLLAKMLATYSVAADIPDFWRRVGESYPQHAGRFTAEPAYFKQVFLATRNLLTETKLKPQEIDFCIFHTPNGKFPRRAAKKLGFTQEQLAPSLIVEQIGNTYAGAAMLALAAVLDQAQPGQKILLTSYGSGAGADSFLFETTNLLARKRKKWTNFVREQIAKLEKIDYQQYQALMKARHH